MTDLARTQRLDTGQWVTDQAAMKLSGTGKVKGTTGVTASEQVRKLLIGDRFMMVEAAPGDPYFAGVLPTEGTLRTISAGGRHYQLAPKSKTWIDTGRASGASAAFGDQLVNALEPATLRALRATKAPQDRLPLEEGPRHRPQAAHHHPDRDDRPQGPRPRLPEPPRGRGHHGGGRLRGDLDVHVRRPRLAVHDRLELLRPPPAAGQGAWARPVPPRGLRHALPELGPAPDGHRAQGEAGPGLEVDDLADVFAAPARRR